MSIRIQFSHPSSQRARLPGYRLLSRSGTVRVAHRLKIAVSLLLLMSFPGANLVQATAKVRARVCVSAEKKGQYCPCCIPTYIHTHTHTHTQLHIIHLTSYYWIQI